MCPLVETCIFCVHFILRMSLYMLRVLWFCRLATWQLVGSLYTPSALRLLCKLHNSCNEEGRGWLARLIACFVDACALPNCSKWDLTKRKAGALQSVAIHRGDSPNIWSWNWHKWKLNIILYIMSHSAACTFRVQTEHVSGITSKAYTMG